MSSCTLQVSGYNQACSDAVPLHAVCACSPCMHGDQRHNQIRPHLRAQSHLRTHLPYEAQVPNSARDPSRLKKSSGRNRAHAIRPGMLEMSINSLVIPQAIVAITVFWLVLVYKKYSKGSRKRRSASLAIGVRPRRQVRIGEMVGVRRPNSSGFPPGVPEARTPGFASGVNRL